MRIRGFVERPSRCPEIFSLARTVISSDTSGVSASTQVTRVGTGLAFISEYANLRVVCEVPG